LYKLIFIKKTKIGAGGIVPRHISCQLVLVKIHCANVIVQLFVVDVVLAMIAI